jgi:type IV pilus assembly protein PilC
MPRYAYQVRDGSGRSDAGMLMANDLDEASRLLRKDGKTIVTLNEDYGAAPAGHSDVPKYSNVKRDEVIFMAGQLAVMVDTGVPLSEALDAIAEQSTLGMKVVMTDVADAVRSGTSLSEAMDRHEKVFGKLFIAMMQASEASGTMGSMLERISQYLQQERDTIKRIKGAMTYPLCMLGFCVVVVVCLLVFVLPKFDKIYAGKGATLPLPTLILLNSSKAIVNNWPIILVVLALVITAGIYYFRSKAGQMFLDKVRINLPIVGPMFRKAYLARSLRTMATMVTTGVSILDGLNIAAKVAGNYYFAKIWLDLAERVKEGATMSDHLRTCPLVPRTVTQMLSSGEKTGKLGMVMNRVAGFCEDDLNIAVKTLTSMVEPIMIIFMGLLVGGIAISLLLPIFSISKVVAR